jgi:hypothetical protein
MRPGKARYQQRRNRSYISAAHHRPGSSLGGHRLDRPGVQEVSFLSFPSLTPCLSGVVAVAALRRGRFGLTRLLTKTGLNGRDHMRRDEQEISINTFSSILIDNTCEL